MARKKASADPFAELTWEDLDDWAGSRILARGKAYQKDGCVSDLARTADGGLIAWVDGTERYATLVHMYKKELESDCTCPYELECKHAVAVVLEYLERLKRNEPVPEAPAEDEREALIEASGDDDWELEDDDDPDLEEEAVADSGADDDSFNRFLAEKTKAELIRMIELLAQRNPGLRQDILDRKRIETGDAKPIIKRLRYLIREASAEPGWQDHWRGEGFTPDYSEVRNKLQELLDAGHADDVLTLGKEFMATGQDLVGRSDDEGETAEGVGACIPVIEKALHACSMPPAEKLVWVVDHLLKDEYDLFEGLAAYLARPHAKDDWSLLADVLKARLAKLPHSPTGRLEGSYARDRLSDWMIRACHEAGRGEEIIPLCEKEAPITWSYTRLVKALIAATRYPEAERWIHEGITTTDNRLPGVSAELRGLLRDIRGRSRDKAAVAALLVDEFVRAPGEKAFADCRRAAEKLKLWEPVRLALLAYLETGAYPWMTPGWPLPKTGTELSERTDRKDFPRCEELIAIAIHEKLPGRVIHWFDRLPEKAFNRYDTLEDCVADAVAKTHPERAAAIWKALAEQWIKEVKPQAYREAAVHLRKLRKLLTETGRTEEWIRYLARIRAEHARKRSLLAVLDSLEKTPIVKKN